MVCRSEGRTKESLRILKDRYKKYRKNWHLIPKESFINKIFNDKC